MRYLDCYVVWTDGQEVRLGKAECLPPTVLDDWLRLMRVVGLWVLSNTTVGASLPETQFGISVKLKDTDEIHRTDLRRMVEWDIIHGPRVAEWTEHGEVIIGECAVAPKKGGGT